MSEHLFEDDEDDRAKGPSIDPEELKSFQRLVRRCPKLSFENAIRRWQFEQLARQLTARQRIHLNLRDNAIMESLRKSFEAARG